MSTNHTSISPSLSPRGESAFYALGRIRARFGSLSDEHEFFHQAVDDPEDPRDKKYLDVSGDAQLEQLYQRPGLDMLLYEVLKQRENTYIARTMVWVLEDVLGISRLIVEPSSDLQLQALVASLAHPEGRLLVVGVGTGRRRGGTGPLAGLPRVQLLRVTRPQLGALARAAAGIERDAREAEVKELFESYVSLTANAGARPEQRAVNYVVLNSPELYALAARLGRGSREGGCQRFELVSAVVADDIGNGARPLADLVLSFQGMDSGLVRRWALSVDVGGLFPFTVGALRPYLAQR